MTIWKRCNDLLFILPKLYLSIVICDKVSTKVRVDMKGSCFENGDGKVCCQVFDYEGYLKQPNHQKYIWLSKCGN